MNPLDEIAALREQPLRYAAQIPWGHTPLSEDQAAILDGYHADPHPGKLAILGDHLQENARTPHEYLIGTLLSRAGDAMRIRPFEYDERHAATVVAHPVKPFHRYGKRKSDAGFFHAAEVILSHPDHRPLSVLLPADREELLQLNENTPHFDHISHIADNRQREATSIRSAPDNGFWSHHVNSQQAEEPTQMQRSEEPVQYAAKKQRFRVHPLVRGTRLELALRTLSADPKLDSVRQLARTALVDPTQQDVAGFTPFHLLKDALLEAGHPLAEAYNWEEVQPKLVRDHHVLQGVKAVTNAIWRQHQEMGANPYPNRIAVAFHVLHDARRQPDDYAPFNRDYSREQRLGVVPIREQLLDHARSAYSDLTEPQFDESLARLHARVKARMGRGDPLVSDMAVKAQLREAMRSREQNVDSTKTFYGDHLSSLDEPSYRKMLEEQHAQHYARGTPSVGGVKNALRLLKSQNQQRNREIAATVLDRLGLSRAKLRDVVTATSSPIASSLAAIYHSGDTDQALRAAAWIGHLQQLPAVSVFHVDPAGKDSVYKLSLPTDPVKADQLTKSYGLGRVLLSPTQAGTDVIIHDPGTRLKDRVEQLATAAGVQEVQHSIGHSVSLGSDIDQPKANAAARKSYRELLG